MKVCLFEDWVAFTKKERIPKSNCLTPAGTERRNVTGSLTGLQRVLWSLICRSFIMPLISCSKPLTISSDRSMEAANLLPSLFQRVMRSISWARRLFFVSNFSQCLQLPRTCRVVMTSLVPHVSPVRYSLLQCCLKLSHLKSPHWNFRWS